MQNNSAYKSSGILVTILFHVVIALLFVYFGFRTPLPLPPEEGILVNFGQTETGFGAAEPLPAETPEEAEKKSTPTPVVEEEKTELTQDFEDAPVIKKKEVVKKKKETKPEKTVKKEEPKPKTETKPVVEEKKANPLALYKGKGTTQSASEGITEGKGNQGDPNGSPNSKNYTGSGKGNAGISYDLDGRTHMGQLPPPAYLSQVEGKVVVEITVDKDGRVTSAVPGTKGSTTLENSLLEAAKQAALKAKFNRKPDAPAYQKGSITYIFKLQ